MMDNFLLKYYFENFYHSIGSWRGITKLRGKILVEPEGENVLKLDELTNSLKNDN